MASQTCDYRRVPHCGAVPWAGEDLAQGHQDDRHSDDEDRSGWVAQYYEVIVSIGVVSLALIRRGSILVPAFGSMGWGAKLGRPAPLYLLQRDGHNLACQYEAIRL